MYIHRNFTHPGGVSPMKQEKVEEGEVKEKKKEGFGFSSKKDYSGTTPTSKAITNFVTPQNNLELGLEFLGGGAGVGIGKGVSKLAKTKVGKKLISKLPWLSKLTEPLTKANKNKGFDFTGGKGKTKTNEFNFSGNKPKGGVDGGKNIIGGNEYYKGATHRGTVTDIKQFDNTIADATSTVGRQGKATDNALAKMDFNVATDLKPKHVKKIGTQSGRDIFEVSYPDGTTQKFWQSSGGGGKTVMYKGKEVSSEGFFGTVAGHMDNKLPVNQATSRADEMYKRGTKEHAQMIDALTNNEGYFIKSNGWQGYGSSTYEQTGASLKEMFEKGLIK